MIKIYYSPSCSSCRKVKKWFDDQKIPYTSKDIFSGSLNEAEIRDIITKCIDGTDEIIYPDATKMFGMLDRDVSNELVVGEGMNHVYPLFPIKEAVNADYKVFHTILR